MLIKVSPGRTKYDLVEGVRGVPVLTGSIRVTGRVAVGVGVPLAMLRYTTLCSRLPGWPGAGVSPVVTDFRFEIALNVMSRMLVG